MSDNRPGDYALEWQIELAAEKLFKADYPSGSFARWLPQFRSSYPDPVGDHYRRRARAALAARQSRGAAVSG